MRVPRTTPPGPSSHPSLPGDASWVALLADTSTGLSGLARWKVLVSQKLRREEGVRHLVVQSYRRADVVEGRPTSYARPLASAQRSVDPQQLAQGVVVDLVNFDTEDHDSVVLAWTEPDKEDLDFEGMTARPGEDAELAEVQPLLPGQGH